MTFTDALLMILILAVLYCIYGLKMMSDDIWENGKSIDQIKRSVDCITEQTDCTECKFVGTYDTEFPCANCVRKNKDYYSAEQTDCPWR